jgi:hypothetical protein
MTLSEENKNSLLVSLHKMIEESANYSVNDIQHNRAQQLINYPPNGGFTANELAELNKLAGNAVLRSALRKVIANASADVVFGLFNQIDGTSDPDIEVGEWSEVMLVDYSDEYEPESMLHDEFYDTYWDWIDRRKSSEERLDLSDK